MSNILIVDSNEDQLASMESVFDTKEHSVTSMNRTEGILHVVLGTKPDIIILDLSSKRAERKEGPVLYKQLRDNDITKSTPIIFLSSTPEIYNCCSFSLNKSIDAVLAKPYDKNDLHKLVKKQINNSLIYKSLDNVSLSIERLKVCQCAGTCSPHLQNVEMAKKALDKFEELKKKFNQDL